MIDLPDEAHVVAFWFVHGWAGDRQSDWLGIVYRPTPDADLLFRYRHRYYNDADVFTGADDKHAYAAVLSGKSEDEAIAIVDELVQKTLIDQNFCRTRLPWKLQKRRWKRVVKGSVKRFFEELTVLPFAHAKTPSDAEYREIVAEREAAKRSRN